MKKIEERIAGNPYVGRGLVAGMSEDGNYAVSAYFIMGRSANSRNRVFVMHGEDMYTEPFEPEKVEDPSLIIYRALTKTGNHLIYTNGDQTDTILEGIEAGKSFSKSLKSRSFEPDGPNWTPRISVMMNFGECAEGKAADKNGCGGKGCSGAGANNGLTYEMSILKSADPDGKACNRFTYDYEALPGIGHFLHTYITDGNPLPTFTGEPERIVIPNDIDEFSDAIWNSLDKENKISLYVRYTALSGKCVQERLINKNQL
ncbi:MAG: inosine monophosphate cyclohydrolase [Firmicutes bacterium]|nr:inosine monophosphate cyclohydrolase [Bacillota bacterium]